MPLWGTKGGVRSASKVERRPFEVVGGLDWVERDEEAVIYEEEEEGEGNGVVMEAVVKRAAVCLGQ